MRRQRLRYAVIAAIVVFGGLATSALAQIPDSDGVIHACYHTSNGGIRVVNDASECGTSEEELTWFQSGAPGSVGARARGPQGETGATGIGPAGPAGPQGALGADGAESTEPTEWTEPRARRALQVRPVRRAARTCRRLRCFGRLREDGDRQGDDRHPPHDGRPSRPRSGVDPAPTSSTRRSSSRSRPPRRPPASPAHFGSVRIGTAGSTALAPPSAPRR